MEADGTGPHPDDAPAYFDTHAHLNDPRLAEDLPAVLARAAQAGLADILIASYDLPSSRLALEICARHGGGPVALRASVGIHPHDAKEADDAAFDVLRDLCLTGGGTGVLPVAIGETGLDYHYDLSPRDVQRAVFRRTMEMARELGMPVVIHEREATEDTLRTIRDLHAEGRLLPVPGVFHCFGGSPETAREVLKLGFFVSFAGPVTFKNAHRLLEAVKAVPPARLLVETDCPYLTPVPHRGERNEPAFVTHVAAAVAALHGLSVETLCGIVRRNAETAFPKRTPAEGPVRH